MRFTRTTALALIVAGALGAAGCGDDSTTSTAGGAGGAASSSQGPIDPKLDEMSVSLEGQGLNVEPLSKSSLDGAVAGVDITGDMAGTVRVFRTTQEAQDYSTKVQKSGDATNVVENVVFQASSQADADAFADAYEG